MHLFDEYGYEFFEKMPPALYERYIRKFYRERMLKESGRKVSLDLKQPKMFSEKIQWLKLYDNSQIKTELTDKILVKDWVKNKIPELNVAKIYTQADKFEDLDFNKCPDKFVIKTNHASGQVIPIDSKEKFLNSDINIGLANTKNIVDFWLSRHFAFHAGFELQYKNIKRKVFVEEYLENITEEFKIFCMNGEPSAIFYMSNIYDDVIENENINFMTILSIDWDCLIPEDKTNNDDMPLKPDDLDKMLNYARILSKDFKFVRVDLMKCQNKIYFGEMTFTPSSGIFEDERFDIYMGNKLRI